MKYRELIQFDPITDIIQLVRAGETKVAERMVKTFVFSQKMKEDIQAVILKNLNPEAEYETKGIQIVGSYGTGKSHLMSLVSAIAENGELLEFLPDEKLKSAFGNIAGKYKVLRFEAGTDKPLKDIVFNRLEMFLHSLGIEFEFDNNSTLTWKELIQVMMAEFEAKFPDFHFLMVIDELLEFLKGRGPRELYTDLMLLRQLGEVSDNSRFKIMFGVQELLYRSPEFQFQAEMLNKIEDRYDDLIITREDVSFVVKERLLKKDIFQKEKIRGHLLKFAHLFEGINSNLNEFVDLFPVHPNYINYFEQIKHGKNQREILKVLSAKFNNMSDVEVPEETPGLITYDTYWKDLGTNPSMLTTPDIRVVKDKLEIVEERINTYFTGARAMRKGIASSISHALAIRILCDDLDKRNGANPQSLMEDLCITLPGVDDPTLLLANIESIAKSLVTATAGQYVDYDPVSYHYFIRTEGGINVPQLIRDYAEEVIKRDKSQADQYFFDFLQYVLEIQQNSYRSGFKIWQHTVEWIDKKSFRKGYIFFGNPNDRSTTEPIQQYYIFFSPLFDQPNRNDEPDEIYFDVSGLSENFKDMICLYGAAKAKEGSASSSQKPLFRNELESYLKNALRLFDKEYTDKIQVVYKGESRPLSSFPLLGEGSTKEMIFRHVAAKVLNKYFNEQFPNYPAFTDLLQPLSDENFGNRISSALKKVANPRQPNRDGEAILSGLGLWTGQNIEIQNSKYAQSLLGKLKGRGDGSVLNRNEILYAHYPPLNLWYSYDFNIDHQLEFVVLASMAFKGEIEITWSGTKTVSATNIETLLNLAEDDYFTFQHIKQPQGIPVKHIKALFTCLGLPDYTSELDKPETITRIITEAQTMVKNVVTAKAYVTQGMRCRNVPLLTVNDAEKMKNELGTLSEVLDKIQSYNTYGKLKSFRYTDEELHQAFDAYTHYKTVDKLKERADKFEKLVSYLYSAQSYVVESEKPLFDDINENINKLGNVINSGNETEIKQYEALLNSMVDRYADYYISQYTRCRLSKSDALVKVRLLQSDKKRICDIIKDSDFITPAEYTNWITSITSLREADENLTKARVKEEPYHDFNPREYYGKPGFNIRELEGKLDEILAKWEDAMRSVLKDPSVQANFDLLNPTNVKIVEDFRTGNTSLDVTNAAYLRDVIRQLTQGIEKVEITMDDIRNQLKRPMTPQEAIVTLTDYINGLCAGKERSKVRIILK